MKSNVFGGKCLIVSEARERLVEIEKEYRFLMESTPIEGTNSTMTPSEFKEMLKADAEMIDCGLCFKQGSVIDYHGKRVNYTVGFGGVYIGTRQVRTLDIKDVEERLLVSIVQHGGETLVCDYLRAGSNYIEAFEEVKNLL